jgi:hypothetical protein
MPQKSQKAKLILDSAKKEQLQRIANSRKAPLREVQRASILLRYSEGIPIVSGIGKGTKTGIGGSFVNQDRA